MRLNFYKNCQKLIKHEICCMLYININPQSVFYRFYHEIIFFANKMLFATNTLWMPSILFVAIILELSESMARF